jgi:hypothetical protein
MKSNLKEKKRFNKIQFAVLLLSITALVVSTTSMSSTIKTTYGQNIEENTQNSTNITSSSDSSKSVEKLRTVNLKQISEQPPLFESLTPGKPIDFENIEKLKNREQIVELVKESINTEAVNFESPTTATTITIDPEVTQKLSASNDIKTKANNESSMETNADTNLNSSQPLFSGTSMSWEGLDQNAGCPSGCFPPDVTVAASETHVVEMVNVAMRVWDKNGTVLATTPLSSFYESGSDFVFDPKIVHKNGHFFAVLANAKDLDPVTGKDNCDTTATCTILAAVSVTNDPLGTWNIYEFEFPGFFPDQPIIAASDDKFAISVNDFDNAACSNGCGQVYVADAAAMIAGTTASFQSTSPDPTVFSIHPIQPLTPTSCINMISTINPIASSQLRLDSACGNPATSSIIFSHLGDITMSPAKVPPNARQPSGGTVETNDARIQTAVQQAGKIWTGFNDACSVDGSTFQACTRLVKIDMASMSLDVDTYIAATDVDTYFPAVTVNNINDLLVIIGTSGPSFHPSLLVGGDNPWTFDPLVVGSAIISQPRYGDYFGAGQDPSDQSSAWVSGEYVNSELPDRWSTFVGKIS